MANILVVDDQPHLQALFAEELRDEGHQVIGAVDSEKAEMYFEDLKPDLVLLDLYLDGFQGWNVLNEIKSKNPDIPVLIVTAYDSYMDDPRLSQADGYLVKSFSHLEYMKQKIDELLNR